MAGGKAQGHAVIHGGGGAAYQARCKAYGVWPNLGRAYYYLRRSGTHNLTYSFPDVTWTQWEAWAQIWCIKWTLDGC